MKPKNKDFWREILGHKMRFFSLVALVAIGVFVLVGLTVTGPMMRKTVAGVLEDANACDVSIRVDEGLEDKDLALLAEMPGVLEKEFFQTLYLETTRHETMYLSSMPKRMSLAKIISGKAPERDTEILLDESLRSRYALGDKVSFKTEEDMVLDEDAPKKLVHYDFVVSGFAKSPEFLDEVNKGTTPKGDKIDGFAYVSASAFKDQAISKVHLQFKDLKGLAVYSDAYEKKNREHEKALESLFKKRPKERLEAMLLEHREKIADAEADVQEGYADLDAGARKIDDGEKKLKAGENKLAANRKTYEQGIREGEEKLTSAKRELAAARQSLEEKEESLKSSVAQVTAGLEEMKGAKAELARQKADFERGRSAGEEEGAAALAALEQQYAALVEKEGTLKQKQVQLKEAQAKLEEAKKDLLKGEAAQKAQEGVLAEKKRTGKSQLNQAERKLSASRGDLKKAQRDYETARADAIEDLLKGEKDIEQAKNLLSILAKPKYEITPINREARTFIFLDYAERVEMLAMIFPVFLFAIAMLLASTVMNRMVDEQRMFIGTYKALGYKNGDIAKKYVFFGSLAALIGGIPGGLLGNFILSRVIAEAYLSSGIFEGIRMNLYPWHIAASVLVGILATGAIAFISVRKSLKLKTATLLLPKTPAKGTRIALERVGFLWKRLSFFHKVTARNLFRDKKRMAMTIVGVMGCVALLVLGFGIRTSVDGLVEKQFDHLHRYDHIILFEEKLSKEDHQAYLEHLSTDDKIKAYASVHIENVAVADGKGLDQSVSLIAAEDHKAFGDLLRLKNRQSGAVLDLKDGVMITEKLAEIKGISTGDVLSFKDDDNNVQQVKIAGIAEGYAGHYMYMDRGHYEDIFKKTMKNNAHLVYSGGKDISHYKDYDCVLAITSTADIRQMVDDIAGHINFIVLVILGASSLLAVVVLSTLTTINIEERRREISTIRVLGFYPKEVTRYIYRETGVLTMIGILLGFLVGKSLHLMVIRVVVPDFAMLDPALGPLNYILPAVITIVISFVLMLWFHKQLQRIDMVEALKGVE